MKKKYEYAHQKRDGAEMCRQFTTTILSPKSESFS